MIPQYTAYEDIERAARKIVAATLENGGGTFSKKGEPVTERDTWAVGGADPGRQINLKRFADDEYRDRFLVEQVGRFLNQLPRRDHVTYIGTWVEGDTLYLDSVSLIDAEFDAIAAAADRREKAIYNLGTHETYYLGM